MGIFPRFGVWINQNAQQPLKGESKKSENVKSKSSVSEIDTNEDRDEMKEQLTLWRVSNKKKQWYDPPPKVKYGKEKNAMKFMEMFEGSYEVEPMYVDSERFCKNMKPKNREEYRKCSGGQGRIASKVKLDQVFKPSSLFNLPPISWYIRWFTVKTTKTLIDDLQVRGAMIRGV
ncbi:unnamed protein product [Microthlaspi erraticum]|uniref:DUF220 domain-containing protein n=1 Tax=Microthlaspi erraticum TaxID=1685480 RepID=A0A6D2IZF4_9BRAS|nr:unnamed protein product [Microthlaspi erraticum]